MKKCLFILSALLSSCIKHTDYQLSHGTTVLAFTDKNRIILASDRRVFSASTNSGKVLGFDTTTKIFQKQSVFFAFAGLSDIKQLYFKDLILNTYSNDRSIEANCKSISDALQKAFHSYIDNMTDDEYRSFSKTTIYKKMSIDLIIATYKNKTPLVCQVVIRMDKRDSVIGLIVFDPIIDSNKYVLTTAGYYDHIKQSPDTLKLRHGDKQVDLLYRLIELEAQNHKEVDSNMDYVIIKPNSFKYGRITK